MLPRRTTVALVAARPVSLVVLIEAQVLVRTPELVEDGDKHQ